MKIRKGNARINKLRQNFNLVNCRPDPCRRDAPRRWAPLDGLEFSLRSSGRGSGATACRQKRERGMDDVAGKRACRISLWHRLVRTNAIDLFKHPKSGLQRTGRDGHQLPVPLAQMSLLIRSMAQTRTPSTTIDLDPAYPRPESVPDAQEFRVPEPYDIEPRARNCFHPIRRSERIMVLHPGVNWRT